MAYNQAYLQKVALDGFAIIDERFSRGLSQGQYPPPRHHNHQKRAPNQYSYEEPDHEPSFRTKQSYETWYVLPVPQAPKNQGAVINDRQAAENYGGKLFKDHGYTTRTVRTYRWGYN